MTYLWYIKRNDFLRFETLKCPEIYLKLCREISLFPAGIPAVAICCPQEIVDRTKV